MASLGLHPTGRDQLYNSLSIILHNERRRLAEEKVANISLIENNPHLKKEKSRLSEEKENSDKRNKELNDTLYLDKETIRNLQTEVEMNSVALGQLQFERTCTLHGLMSESTRLHYGLEQLPKDLVGTVNDIQDVWMFLGV